MNLRRAHLAALAALAAAAVGLAGPLRAGELTGSTGTGSLDLTPPSALSLRVGAAALAPAGFISFCGRHPDDCRDSAPATAPLVLNAARWRTLEEINSAINLAIRPESDMEVYHRPEYWEYPVTAGDCEDFALLKKRQLEASGFPRANLLLTVVVDEKNAGHAVLTVVTNLGDLILDNRRDAILNWSESGYRFVKRESAEDPSRWVRLETGSSSQTLTADAPSVPADTALR